MANGESRIMISEEAQLFELVMGLVFVIMCIFYIVYERQKGWFD